MTKRMLILAMVLALAVLLGGCCQNPIDPNDTQKKFVYCTEKLQDKICNAPDTVLAVVDIIISLLKPEVATLIPGSAPYISYVTANNIKATGCAAITDLNTMINFIQGYNTAKIIAAKGTKAAPAVIDVAPLLAWK